MTTILRFDVNDLRELVAEKTGADLCDVTFTTRKECVGYGMGEREELVTYVEVYMHDKKCH